MDERMDESKQSEKGDQADEHTASQLTLRSMKLVDGDSQMVFWRKEKVVPKGTMCVEEDKAMLLFEVSATGPGKWEARVAMRNERMNKLVSIEITTDRPKTCWVWLDEPLLIPDGANEETLFDFIIGARSVAKTSITTTKSPGSTTTEGPMLTTDTVRNTSVSGQNGNKRSLESNGSSTSAIPTPAADHCLAEYKRGLNTDFFRLIDGDVVEAFPGDFIQLRLTLQTTPHKPYTVRSFSRTLNIDSQETVTGKEDSHITTFTQAVLIDKNIPLGSFDASISVYGGNDVSERLKFRILVVSGSRNTPSPSQPPSILAEVHSKNTAGGQSEEQNERSLESNGSATPIRLTPAVVRPFGCRADFQREVNGAYLPLEDGTTITVWTGAFLNLRMHMSTVATKSYRMTISCPELDIRVGKDFKERVDSQSRTISKYYWIQKKRPVGVYPASFSIRSGFDREEVAFFISLVERPENVTDTANTSRSNTVEPADPNEGHLPAGLPRISGPTPDPHQPLIGDLFFKRSANDQYRIIEKGIPVSAGATVYIGANLLTDGLKYNITFVCKELGIQEMIQNAEVSGKTLYSGIGRKIGIPSRAAPGEYKMKITVTDHIGRSEERSFDLDLFPPRG